MKNAVLMLIFLLLFSAVIAVYAAAPPPPPPPPPIGGSIGSNQSAAANAALPSCSDHASNQQESDVDCGGSCTKCDDSKSCNTPNDCKSSYCNPDSKCSVPSCSDGWKNGNETDIDCGAGCKLCPVRGLCITDSDCATGYCNPAKACTYQSCDDGFKNGNETGVDCGGSCISCIQLSQNQAQTSVQNQQEQRNSQAQASSQSTQGASQLQAGAQDFDNSQKSAEVIKDSAEEPKKSSLILIASVIFNVIFAAAVSALLFLHFKNANKGLPSFDKNNANLKDFIGRNLKLGHSTQSIRQALLKKGWQEQSINRAFNELKRW